MYKVYDTALFTGDQVNATGFVLTVAPSLGDCSVAGPNPTPDSATVDDPVAGATVRVAV